jgi:hypothetical protein
MFIVFNRDSGGRRGVVRFNDEGITIYTRDNYRLNIKLDQDIQIDGNKSEKIKGNCDIEVTGECNITSKGDCNVKSAGQVNIDGSKVNINSGKAKPASTKDVKDLETSPGCTNSYHVGASAENTTME